MRKIQFNIHLLVTVGGMAVKFIRMLCKMLSVLIKVTVTVEGAIL